METFLVLLFAVVALIAFEGHRRTRRLPRVKGNFGVAAPGDEQAERRVKLERGRKPFR